MYTVYILQSTTSGKRYVGYTSELSKRLERHNRGLTKTTRNQGKFWKLIYKEEFEDKKMAIGRERTLKKMKGGEGLKDLIKNAGIVHR